MHIKNKTCAILMMVCLAGCINKKHRGNTRHTDTSLPERETHFPKVDVTIRLLDTLVHTRDDVRVRISLTNHTPEKQVIFFGKWYTHIDGPWPFSVKVIDAITGKSVLRYENRMALSSQLYREDEVTSYPHTLMPGKTLSRVYSLIDLVVFKPQDNLIPVGIYYVQVLFGNSVSNIAVLKVQ